MGRKKVVRKSNKKVTQTTQPALSFDNLRLVLWDNLYALKDGNIEPSVANSINKTALGICKASDVQLSALKLAGKVSKADVKKLLM